MIFQSLRKITFENPFAVWGLGLGFGGPLLVLVVPPIRRALGYKAPKAIPEKYPCKFLFIQSKDSNIFIPNLLTTLLAL